MTGGIHQEKWDELQSFGQRIRFVASEPLKHWNKVDKNESHPEMIKHENRMVEPYPCQKKH